MRKYKKSVYAMMIAMLNLAFVLPGKVFAEGEHDLEGVASNQVFNVRKVAILGGFNEGKTSFLRAIVGANHFMGGEDHTHKIEAEIPYDVVLRDGSTMTLELQDFPGDQSYRYAFPQYIRDASWAFVCVGMDSKLDGSTEYADAAKEKRTVDTCVGGWIDYILDHLDKRMICQIVIVKTKKDICAQVTKKHRDVMEDVRSSIRDKVMNFNMSGQVIPAVTMIEVDSVGSPLHARSEFERVIRDTVNFTRAYRDYQDVGAVKIDPESSSSDCCTIM